MKRQFHLILLALQFLTRLPLPADPDFEPSRLRACASYFPLAGAVIGAWAALVLVLALRLWPPLVAAALSLAATVWLTGALHEDGLADTADALGSRVSRERALDIMKDSRIGSYAAVAVGLALILRVACVAELARPARAAAWAVPALIGAHAQSRAAPVWIMGRLPYAADASRAKAAALAQRLRGGTLAAALAWGVAWSVASACAAAWLGACSWGHALGLAGSELAAAAAATLLAQRWLDARLGGFTGDTLGAVQQLVEMVGLLVWLAWLPAGPIRS